MLTFTWQALMVLGLQQMYAHYHRDEAVLAMEREEGHLLEHAPFLLTVGRCVIHSFYMPVSVGACGLP